MKIKILNSESCSWNQDKVENYSILIKGYYWINDTYYEGNEGASTIIEILTKKNINQIKDLLLGSFSGHYAFIIRGPLFALAVVDKVRSIPIFFTSTTNQITFSNSADLLRDELVESNFDYNSLNLFKMTGYCLGNQTLFENINQLKSGQFIFFEKADRKIFLKSYYRYFNFSEKITDRQILTEKLHEVTQKTFQKMIHSFRDRQVMVPLSGGYDSRLILAILKESGYKNFKAYTYGIKNLWEVKRAKYIAKFLNVDCVFIEFHPSKTRKIFKKQIRKKYFKYAGGLSSTPHLPDFYAILKMKSLGIINDNSIFVNGQSGDFISGGHLPEILKKDDRDNYKIEELIDNIISKHFSLWSNLKTKKNRSIIIEQLSRFFDSVGVEYLNKERFAMLHELFEFEERQSKFVVNGQRVYEFFGYNWRLPLWSDELIEFWENVPWSLKYNQNLYLDYLRKMNFSCVFSNITLPPQYSYFPPWSFVLRVIFKIFSHFSNRDISHFYNKYLKYHMAYGHSYPQESYFDYLKDSQFHRNPISYGSQEYIKELDSKILSENNQNFF